MKIGILADTHLGITRFQKYHGLQNKVNHINTESTIEAFEILKSHHVDKIIHGGDLFDKPSPDVSSIIQARYIVNNLDIDTSIIGGNHDYSKKLDVENQHVFDLINYKENIHLYHKDVQKEIYDQTMIIYVPYKSLGENSGNTFKFINESILSNKDLYKILVFHGSIDYDGNEYDNEYNIPMEIIDLFDFVTMGHVHVANIISNARNKLVDGKVVTDDVYHLTPGSTIPSPRANQDTKKPSVYILDTEKGSLESIELTKTYKVKEYTTNNINLVLEQIANGEPDNLHVVEYNDAMSLIDETLYLKASQNSIKILIRNNMESDKIQIKKVEEFWQFVEKKYPDLLEEFKEVKNE